MRASQPGEHGRQEIGAYRHGRSQTRLSQPTFVALAPHGCEGFIHVLSQPPCMLDELVARGGGIGALAHALDELHAETFLELADLEAHCGLCEPQLLRGGGEAAEGNHLPERLKLVEVEAAHERSKIILFES